MLTPEFQTCKGRNGTRDLSVVLVVAILLAGCATVETQSFTVAKNSNVESAQIATDADFSRYDKLQAEEMGIYFPPAVAPPGDDLQRIRQIFRQAFISELEGYEISRDAGPSTMKVQASLIDLRGASSADIPQLRSSIVDVARSGSLVFLMEMRDSQTDRVLARAADSASTPTFAGAQNVQTDWSSVESAAERWAALFRQFLDANLGR